MGHIGLWAQWTGFATWIITAWLLLAKIGDTCSQAIARRRLKKRFLAAVHSGRGPIVMTGWTPPEPPPDSGDDVTRVIPAIQRPRAPKRGRGNGA